MDIMQAITFLPEEDRWIEKLAIGVGVVLVSSVLSFILVGILGFFILAGYSIRLLQNVRDGRQPILPEWDDWGGDLSRGFKYVVVGLVWGLGIFLLFIPAMFGAAISDSNSGFVQFIGASIMAVGFCLTVLYGIFVVLVQPGFTIAFAEDERIHSGLEFSRIWGWTRANLGQVIIVAIAVLIGEFVISMLAGIAGVILCGIGLLVTIPLSMVVIYIFQFHLFGQLAREFPMDGSQPTEAVPPTPDEPVSELTGLIGTEESADAGEGQVDPEESTLSEEEVRDAWAEAEEATPTEEEVRDIGAETGESASSEDDADNA